MYRSDLPARDHRSLTSVVADEGPRHALVGTTRCRQLSSRLPPWRFLELAAVAGYRDRIGSISAPVQRAAPGVGHNGPIIICRRSRSSRNVDAARAGSTWSAHSSITHLHNSEKQTNMKATTVQVVWHMREPVLSVDFEPLCATY